MEAILTSLITQLKNPWQYICVGAVWCAVLYFNLDRQYLAPLIITSLGFAYLFEKLLTKIMLSLFKKIKEFFVNKNLLKTLKNCTAEEKDFLYNRLYENDNERSIEMNRDSYFYKEKQTSQFGYPFTYELYKKQFNTKEKVIKFLRQLENKGIIQAHDNKSMIIPMPVWNLLTKKADEIFKNFLPLPITPTEDKIKWAKITYNAISKEHKDILRKIMLSPSSEYLNIKVLSSELASQANLLKMYPLFKEFQVDFNACIAIFSPDLYSILDTILKEEANAE